MQLDNNNHSVFLMHYHLVLGLKYIRKKLWKEYFWSRSFCLLTKGEAPIEVVGKYIESQGEIETEINSVKKLLNSMKK